MTGNSCDALDASCIEFRPGGWKALWSASAPYPAALRKRVLAFQKPKVSEPIQNWLRLDADLGDWFGRTLTRIIRSYEQQTPDVIANHGQTLAHFPGNQGGGTTLQLGEAARIAAATGITTICQFRSGDMAAGGQGAPLLPMFHAALAIKLDPDHAGVAIHNIGGISNLTYAAPGREALAFDTGPGNIWMDAATALVTRGKQRYDRGGKLAERGVIDVDAVRAVMRHPYFRQKAPKSTGRDDFPFEFLTERTRARGADLVATATAITVESIGQAYEKFLLAKSAPLRRIYVCGGGAYNPVLLQWLRERLPGVAIRSLKDAGIDPQYVEAQGFALFGLRALAGLPLGGKWTGARGFGPPAHIVPGKNWHELLCKI